MMADMQTDTNNDEYAVMQVKDKLIQVGTEFHSCVSTCLNLLFIVPVLSYTLQTLVVLHVKYGLNNI